MKKKSIGLVFLLALSMISMIPMLSTKPVAAAIVPKPGEVVWADPNGQAAEANLTWNPEFLKLWTLTTIHSNTTIIVQGTDAYGQNIEATAVIPPNTPMENTFMLNDTHTTPPMQVAFSHITAVFQQNGTHNNKVLILTEPEPFEDYLGEYHADVGYEPGQCHPAFPVLTNGSYYVGHGSSTTVTTQTFPVEPSNPDPLKIVINWADGSNGNPKDLIPQSGELGHAFGTSILTLEGLDEAGNKLIVSVTVHAGDSIVIVNAGLHTFSTLCKIWGGGSDSYYILTEPSTEEIPICTYALLIDHLTIQPACYDIMANPQCVAGNTTITVALVDQDGNLIHSGGNILINFWTSGGKIQPSNDVWIRLCNRTATVNLTADTNARTIKVVADANVPLCTFAPAMNLRAWTEMTFDGINSVQFTGGWPIHTMMWGYNSTAYPAGVTLPVPPKPVLPPELGGPAADGIKLDGPIYEVMIPLYVGCNLISSPVHPMLCTNYYCEAYPTMNNHAGIPMDLLFGNTSATTCIEAIWWYNGSDWFHYIPGVDGSGQYFTDGVGYWIYAEKPCTLEISGVFMDNAPFTPPKYTTVAGWNLMGVTSLTGISLSDYLESDGYGPVWVYYAKYGTWARDPSWGLWPTEAFWLYTSSATKIAP